jgi:methylaspartate ammonia-lyase
MTKEGIDIKRFISVFAALLISINLTSCGSNNQASEIAAACELAKVKDFDGTTNAFAEIAAKDSGYIGAAAGARAWANAKGGNVYGLNYLDEVKPIVYKAFLEFYALCIDLP